MTKFPGMNSAGKSTAARINDRIKSKRWYKDQIARGVANPVQPARVVEQVEESPCAVPKDPL